MQADLETKFQSRKERFVGKSPWTGCFIIPFIRAVNWPHAHIAHPVCAGIWLCGFVLLTACSMHCKHLCGSLWVILREPQRPHIITRMLSTRPYDAPSESGLYYSDCTNLALLARQHARPVSACPWFGGNFSMTVLIPQCRKWWSRVFSNNPVASFPPKAPEV